MNPLKLKLHWQILIALVAGVLLAGALKRLGLGGAEPFFGFLGQLFLNGLRMLIVPLIASSIVVAVAGLGGGGGLGRLGGRALGFYAVSSAAAILTGLLLVNWIQPGVVGGEPAGKVLNLEANADAVAEKVGERSTGDLWGIFLRMVPANIVAAAAEGQMLGIIFFSILFGYFISRMDPSKRGTLEGFFQGMYEVMLALTRFIMLFAPIGVFGLVARVVLKTDLADLAGPLLRFSLVVLSALALHFLVTMPLVLRFVARVNPAAHYRAMAPALLTAFSTASSSATLPVTMECVQDRAGVSNRVSSFSLPLGATVNMDGTALYECVAAMFIAQAYGVELGFAAQFTVVLTALLTSIGVAGIPSASFVAIAVILGAVGLPLEALGLLFVFDRILDMCRTSVNVFGDSCCAVTLAKWEGETGVLRGA